MNKSQTRKLRMFEVTKQLLEQQADPAIIAKMPRFDEYQSAFFTAVTELQLANELQSHLKGGGYAEKTALRNLVVAEGLEIAAALRGFAMNTSNADLRQSMSYTEAKFDRYSDIALLGHLRAIATTASLYLNELKTYQVTSEAYAAFGVHTEAFHAAISKPRKQVVQVKDATLKLKLLFAEGDALLDRMDTLMEVIEAKHADFSTTYRNSRIIIDAGYRRMALRVSVTDASGAPLGKVRITIKDTDIRKLTTSKGNCQIKELPEGIYDLKFHKNGYEDVVKTVNITDNERCDVKVVM